MFSILYVIALLRLSETGTSNVILYFGHSLILII